MTQEFEEWLDSFYACKEGLMLGAMRDCWQARGEQLKAKLLSDEMVRVLLDAINKHSPLTRLDMSKASLEAIVREL